MDIIRFENLPVPVFESWKIDSTARMNRHWERVSADAGDVKSITVLIKPCPPYEPTSEGLELSSFYVISNELHSLAGKAVLNLPVKPLLAGYGIGRYGRSGVISIPGVGTRFAAAVIASDDEPDPKWVWHENAPLAEECAACNLCMENCPNHALMGDGRVDVDRCLRAQAQFQEPRMPDSSRDMLGASLWGCDICQQECPRNKGIYAVKMPEDIEQALELKKLLMGDVAGLGKWLGSNYARPARMQARACLVAANTGRKDLINEITALLCNPIEAVRDCAEWAINKLQSGGK